MYLRTLTCCYQFWSCMQYVCWKNIIICDWICKKVFYIYTYPMLQVWSSITSFNNKILNWNFLWCKYNDRNILLPNFKAVGQTQAEWHSLKSNNWMFYKTLFAGPVTYVCVICMVIFEGLIFGDGNLIEKGFVVLYPSKLCDVSR